MRLAKALVLVIVVCGITAAGCGDNGGGAKATLAPTVSIGPSATPGATSTPRAAATVTGIPEIDALLDAIAVNPPRARREALTPLLGTIGLACKATISSDNPVCRQDEALDTIVQVLPFNNCSQLYLRPDEFNQVLILLSNSQVYGVYHAPASMPDSDYAVIIYQTVGGEKQASVLSIDNQHITSYTASCTTTPDAYVQSLELGDPIYQPPGQ